MIFSDTPIVFQILLLSEDSMSTPYLCGGAVVGGQDADLVVFQVHVLEDGVLLLKALPQRRVQRVYRTVSIGYRVIGPTLHLDFDDRVRLPSLPRIFG